MLSDAYLKVEDLCVDLGEFRLQDINIDVARGDYVIIIGPTGSGKTILLEAMLGFHKMEKGAVILDGRDITHLRPEHKGIGIVYQDYALFPHMDVFDNIAYGLKKQHKGSFEAEVHHISSILSIEALLHRKPDTLSGGEMQRVALARALIVKPDVLFLDEPFSALDVRTREALREMIKSAIAEYSTTVLHVTHDLEDLWSLANKVVVMKKGRILQQGIPEEVFNRPASDEVATFLGTNILEGKVSSISKDITTVNMGEFDIYSLDHGVIGERVKVSVRPEDMILSLRPLESSAMNVIPGEVVDVLKHGHVFWVLISTGGLRIRSVLTPDSCRSMHIEKGKPVYVIFKTVNARIIG